MSPPSDLSSNMTREELFLLLEEKQLQIKHLENQVSTEKFHRRNEVRHVREEGEVRLRILKDKYKSVIKARNEKIDEMKKRAYRSNLEYMSTIRKLREVLAEIRNDNKILVIE